MKTQLINIIFTINSRYPRFGDTIKRIYYRKPFDKIKRRIIGVGNEIRHAKSSLHSVFFDINGNGNQIDIKDNVNLRGVVFHIRGDHHRIEIKNGCRMNGGSIWFEDSECYLLISENTTFENVHIALTELGSRVQIGNDCMFAYDIDIRVGDSHSILDSKSMKRIN